MAQEKEEKKAWNSHSKPFNHTFFELIDEF